MIRQAFLAGAWYPGDPRSCREAIERHAAETTPQDAPWRAIIAPHAGWFYSGDAAGRSYRWLANAHADADLVVIFGSHRGPQGPNTIFCGSGWQTPMGVMQTAHPLAQAIEQELQLSREPVQPHRPDNAVEVQLPFIRHFFPRAELLMLGVAAAPAAIEIGRAVGERCRDEKRDAVIVGSTDLTHYGPNYGFSPHGRGERAIAWVRNENDRDFLDHLLAGDASGLLEHAQRESSACCPGAVAAALEAAAVLGDAGRRELVDHYLSCDVQPNESFVGYAGVVF